MFQDFRLLLIGYFEGLDAERAITWRAADSFARREFLNLVLPKDCRAKRTDIRHSATRVVVRPVHAPNRPRGVERHETTAR